MNTKHGSYVTRAWIVVAALGIAGVAVALGYRASARANESPVPASAPIQSWHDNGAGGRYVLRLDGEAPEIPTDGISGVVMTDSDCAPDANGLSHCHNQIELESGARITVVDSHQMNRHRCLQPGEPIRLRSIGRPWVLGEVRSL